MEADFGGGLHMEVDFGVNCINQRYLIGMSGAAF
jgi:hypothetical protein